MLNVEASSDQYVQRSAKKWQYHTVEVVEGAEEDSATVEDSTDEVLLSAGLCDVHTLVNTNTEETELEDPVENPLDDREEDLPEALGIVLTDEDVAGAEEEPPPPDVPEGEFPKA